MGPFASRQVILLPFPFSDLSASKLRPALLLASAGKVFTANETLFQRAVGQLKAERHAQVVNAVVDLVRTGL